MANTNDMNTPTKVPCGGFVLGEGLALSKDGKTLNVTGGGGGGNPNLLINPSRFPTLENPEVTESFILCTSEVLDDDGKLKLVLKPPAQGVLYIESNVDYFYYQDTPYPTNTFLSFWSGRNGTRFDDPENYKTKKMSFSSSSQDPTVNSPAVVDQNGEALFPYRATRSGLLLGSDYPISGAIVALKSTGSSNNILMKKINCFEEVSFLAITSSNNYIRPIVSADEYKVVDLIACADNVAGVGIRVGNRFASRKFFIKSFYDNKVTGFFLTDYDPKEIPEYSADDVYKGLKVDKDGNLQWSSELVLPSSTANSIKKFRITVDDTGTIKATEVTDN